MTRLREAAASTPPEALIPAVRAQLRYAGRLLEHRPTLGQHRRLLVAAGWLSVLLAQLLFDAGAREAAEASRDAAFRLAGQAGHPELAAWAVEALALWGWPTAGTGTPWSWPRPARTWPRRPARPPSSSRSTRPRPGRPWVTGARPTAPGARPP